MARRDRYSDERKQKIAECQSKKNARRKKRKRENAKKRLQEVV